jgi:DNA-binding MarR family transcriptional regulator
MLKTVTSYDQNDLHFAWVEETRDATSRLVHSEVNLAQNTTGSVNVQDVNGQISQLALASIRNGEVVLGWAYVEPTEGGRITCIARYSVGQNTRPRILETSPRDVYEVESMTLDSQGNLHVVWAYPFEEVRAGPGPIAMRQQGFYYAEFGEGGQLSEERQEVSYVPTVAAFVTGNGEVYVVSEGGVLETASPERTGNPAIFLLAFVVFASAVGGILTEPGTYLVASWSMERSIRSLSTGASEKLLRKIRRHPGIALAELKSLTQRSGFSLAVQLRALEKSGMIRSLRDGRRERFYCLTPNDRHESHAEQLRGSIVRLVEHTPGMTEAQIARSLGASQQLTNYHLRRLVDARFLYRLRCPDNIGYYVKDWMLKNSDNIS